jgi:holin-like protein
MHGLLILLVFLMAGTWLQSLFLLPVPAAIVGMLLLLCFLLLRRSIPAPLQDITRTLSPWLPLFLVPVSVGIVTHKALLAEHGPVLLLILAVSLVPGILVCGWIMSRGKQA